MGSQAMHMRHNLTTVPLARVGTEEVGGWLFFAVCGERCHGDLDGWSAGDREAFSNDKMTVRGG